MIFFAAKVRVLNRGVPPDSFLTELVEWCKGAPDEIFAPNPNPEEIYAKVRSELGPWQSILHRRAVMLEVQRVLAGFESSWDWTEGVDTSRLGESTQENSEAGAWQESYDSRLYGPDLLPLLHKKAISNGVQFQQAMKFDHAFAMEYTARLLRSTCRLNGPLYKDNERLAIRKSLRGAENSIYPWLSRAAVAEFQDRLS